MDAQAPQALADAAPDPEVRRQAGSVCPHDCPSGCTLTVDVTGQRIGRLRGAPHPYTGGVICAKVARYAERVHHPDRLTVPLKRVGPKGQGAFVPVSWDEALDTVAAAFTRAIEAHGAESVWPYFYAGTMGHTQRGSIERLRNALGASRQKQTICSAIAKAGWTAGTGVYAGTDPRQMAEADVIVVWGGNPVNTQVHVMNWIAKARKTRGAKLVVVDPYRTATAEKADLHVMPRPGTDAAVACGVMHVLFREGLADRAWMAAHTDVPAEMEAHLAGRTPAWAESISGVPAAEIEAFARLYGGTRRSFLRVGYGLSRQRNGAASLHAVSCLPAVTGAWAAEAGGGALQAASGGLLGLNKAVIEGTPDESRREIDMCRIGPALTGDDTDLRGGPPVMAMLVQNSNPAVVAPDSGLVREGFLREDLFLCVHEQFLTDTARYADIVLPATTFLEHDDLYTAYGHYSVQTARAVIPPQGEARPNHDVVNALAERLGIADRHPGFRRTAWELVEASLAPAGLEADALSGGQAHVWGEEQTEAFRQGRFGHADGRFHFAADWGAEAGGLPRLPDYAPLNEAADAEHPFKLITAPARNFLNTSFTETPTSQSNEGRPRVLLHPADRERLGIDEGDVVRMGNRRGALTLETRDFDGLQPGVVVVESIWPGSAFPEGVGINLLIGADAAPPHGGGVFHDAAVWLRPAAGER